MKNKNLSETVPLAEFEVLKEKYETLVSEHENLIKMLEILEKTNGFVMEDMEKKKREEIEKFENKIGEMQKNLEKAQNDIKEFMSLNETNMNLDVNNSIKKKNIESNKDVIVISDDDEENQRESNRRDISSSRENLMYYFSL